MSDDAATTLPLSRGELAPHDVVELQALKRQIETRAAFRCDAYKEKCLRRRIAVRMRARGVHTYRDYARLLANDDAEYESLVDALTINVSKFYRNPEVWAVVREMVLPALVARPEHELRIWSAGTAGGEEAYTLSTLIHDFADGDAAVIDRFRILATDIDRQSLSVAQRAEYTGFSMTDIAADTRERWFEHDGVYRLRADARRNVRFDSLDLLGDDFPADQHLIVCRNVIIYFERAVQEGLFRRFRDALVPGGFLVLGKVEALFGAASGLFEPVSNRLRVFRKP